MIAWAAVIAALAVATPEPASPQPVVALVEVHRYLPGNQEWYVPPGAPADYTPETVYIAATVRPALQISGPRLRQETRLEWVAGSMHLPGIVMLVIAEPSRRGGGLFARWFSASQDGRGRYCVPEAVLTELGAHRGLRAGARWRDGDQPMRCFSSPHVTVD